MRATFWRLEILTDICTHYTGPLNGGLYTKRMKHIVAVSGGVDSVVLLHTLSKDPNQELIVAHFDHGIRPDSHEDAAFVEALAKRYGHTFEMRREELGKEASEAVARERRYAFLQQLANKYQAPIVTAHHLDDLVETVAINLTRGTGWRGLAVFHPTIKRPLIDIPKQAIIAYARAHKLEWREDSTNTSEAYLRNRLRNKAHVIDDDTKRQLRALHARQRELRTEINSELKKLIGEGSSHSRYLFTSLQPTVAMEALRLITNKALTRPQLERLLHAVKTAPALSTYEAGMGITVHFSTRYFTL